MHVGTLPGEDRPGFPSACWETWCWQYPAPEPASPRSRSTSLNAPVRPSGLVSVALLLVSIFFAIGGQLMLKSAMTRIGRIGYAQATAPFETVTKALREPRLWGGLALFAASAAFWLVVLSRLPLSVAYPALGVSHILVALLSGVVLHEHVPLLRWVGVLVVAVGIALIGMSFRPAEARAAEGAASEVAEVAQVLLDHGLLLARHPGAGARL